MRGVSKRFGSTIALDDVDLEVRAGEVHAIVGENGAGKSTLIKILSGVHQGDRGDMLLDGVPFAPASPADARAAEVATIHQELSLAGHLSVAQNIVLGREPLRLGLVDVAAERALARAALARLGHGDMSLDVLAGHLTAANQQLVEIARAVATGCRVLVLDEPTSSLDGADVDRLLALLRTLRDEGVAVIYISHVLEEVEAVADRCSVLRDGRVVAHDDAAQMTQEQIVVHMVGRNVDTLYPHSERVRGDVALTLDALVAGDDLHEASLELRCGEVLGIAGLVGAGRSTMVRAIFGLERVRDGSTRVGAWSAAATPGDRWRQGVGMVAEDRRREGLALGLSVADNLTLPSLQSAFIPPRRPASDARPWIDRLCIRSTGPMQPTWQLSGGSQQKVALARLLHADVDVLLLDEPTRGIDVASKAEIYGLIDAAALEGRAVLLVSSYVPELLGICDRIAVMRQGRLGAARDVTQWDARSILLEAAGVGVNV